MIRPWMPLYIADYLADTAHLDAIESGAYLHLIMHYWLNDGVPDNDRQLARISKMTDRQWSAARDTLAAFFHDGWKHKRIDAELAKASDISSKRRASAEQRHNKRDANALQLDTHARASSPSHLQSKKDAAGAALELPLADDEADLYRRGKQVLGKDAGGLIKRLVVAKGGKTPLARAAIEQASTKQDPREYIGAVIRGNPETSSSTVDPRL